jgi:dinuclear metal center YbgI/SA1388 family protein
MHANASVDEIAAFLDRLLDAEKFRQHEPEANGLVFRAGAGVSKFAAAVNTSLTTIVGAAKTGANLMIVHHTTWPGIDRHLHAEKMAALEAAGVSLYCAHSSLDCAPEFGNGWTLARLIGAEVETAFGELAGGQAGVIARYDGTFAELVQMASAQLGVQVEAHQHAKTAGRVAVITGAGGMTSWMDEARQLGADTYLTGEGSMYTRMFARETGMNLIFGTHHATEAPGIKALAGRLEIEASIPWEFIADSADVF